MFRRIAAIVFIFVCASVAWMILAATVSYRSENSDAGLRGRVVSTWGAPHEQKPPSAGYNTFTSRVVESVEDGKKIEKTVNQTVFHPLPLDSSRIQVGLQLEHRQKGLRWFSTYKVAFDGVYTFHNPTDGPLPVNFALKFPSAQATYDDLVWTADGAPLKAAAGNMNSLDAGKSVTLHLAYHSQGLDRWTYNFDSEVSQVHDFSMRMTTNFKDIDFADNTLSPTIKQPLAGGWELIWN